MGVFIIAEAGSNWRMGEPRRDLKMAKSLIDVAVEARADAVKFQTYKPETVYVENAGESDYLAEAGIKESIRDIFQDLSMPYDMIPVLAAYCKHCGIEFMSTPFSIGDAEAIDPYVSIHKIASYEISHAPLLGWLAKTGKPLVMSTGGATCEDIQWATDFFYKSGGKRLMLMQCTAKYPAPLFTLNLRTISYLQNQFGVEVGLSDHSRDPLIGPLGAVALGASVIEKHFTLHNKLPGPDHSFAISPDELKLMVSSIRKMEEALGDGIKKVQPEENELRHFAQRAIQTTRKIRKGEILAYGVNVDVLRPGKRAQGAHPKHLQAMEGKKASRDIELGDGVGLADWQ